MHQSASEYLVASDCKIPFTAGGGGAGGGALAASGLRTLRPRTGPPIATPAEGLAGVICVLLRPTEAPPSRGGASEVLPSGDVIAFALDGTFRVVFERPRAASLSGGGSIKKSEI